jgi:hypothetical protein
MISKSGLLLPDSVSRDPGLEGVRATPQQPPRLGIPPEMIEEVKKYLPEVRALGEAVKALMDKGQPAQVAMLADESIRKFIEVHIIALLPHLAAGTASADRQQLIAFLRQVLAQRVMQAGVTGEEIHQKTYEMAISDLTSLSAKIPAPVLPIKIGIPDLGEGHLPDPSSETPVTVNSQGA